MHNHRLTLAYDGTHYLGWQRALNGPSIEETLQNVLERLLQQPISLQAASRTDAGVHAKAQVANFFTKFPIEDYGKLLYSLNCLLPKDIRITKAEEASAAFHPTVDANGKIYHYEVCLGTVQSPVLRHFSWHFTYPVCLSSMREAAQILIGKHDFQSFTNAKKNERYTHHICTLARILIEELPSDRLLFIFEGDRFLYKMVRNLVGTLLYVGCGKIALGDLPSILAGKNRVAAGMTAPAHGLTLHRVLYN